MGAAVGAGATHSKNHILALSLLRLFIFYLSLYYVFSFCGLFPSAAVALAAAPFALAAVGFTSGGIAAGSYAASMMSSAAANGGGVAAGTVVAALQSAG